MSSINWGRVIFGGLLAGVVINVVGFFLNGVEVTPFLLNLYPRRILAISLTVGLAEVLLATLFGAWLYREPSLPDGMPSPRPSSMTAGSRDE